MISPKPLALVVVALLVFAGVSLRGAPACAALERYVRKAEPEFAWRLKADNQEAGDRIYDLHFVSQVWQGIRWEHQLQVYQPRDVAPGATLLLWITGGSARPGHVALGMELARQGRVPVAFLYNIPNQPLLEQKLWEDDLIAETFVRYLKTGDETWPLLLPMVKSVVKAMDVLESFGKKEWARPVNKFIVSGASKRGWTAWLTAAVDARVSALAPVVIDVINMRVQMSRQLETLGAYSVMLAPYSSRGLLPIPKTTAGERLLNIVDPWAYRDRLTMPKLIINGTNDFYWATDALNLYWKGIPEGKWVLYIPNAGHDLRRKDRPATDGVDDLVRALAAFARHQISGAPMPRLSWKHEDAADKLRLTVHANPAPLSARLWTARTPSLDLRGAQWTEEPAKVSGRVVTGETARPEKGRLAFFAELDYLIDGTRYSLSTQMRIAE